MTASIPIQFPSQFRGMFQRVESTYRPLLEDALKKVHQVPIPVELRPFFDHVTVESPQPSFMLIPLMFLAAAEASGGITPRHIDALPSMLLSMEVTAIADDTVDRTPMRSGRMSFPRRFGEASATPFTGALLMLMAQHARRCPPEFNDALLQYVLRIFSMFLWERQNTYPEQATYEHWLSQRYAATGVATAFAIDSALALNGRAPLPASVVERFSFIFQDVDDLVGLLERRDEQGENDDLQMGIVTRPLILSLTRRPELASLVEQLWKEYRPLHRASLIEFQQQHAEVSDRTRFLHERLRQAMLEIGVPEAARCMIEDLRLCLEETPTPIRPFLRELTLSIIDRLQRCEDPEVNRILAECFLEEKQDEATQPGRSSTPAREPRTICVYCSSSGVVEPAWFELAAALGAEIGKRGDRLVFGGGNTGLMGAVAHATREHGGEVISVIPEVMRGTPYVFEPSTELVVTRDLRGRKAAMETRADAFVVLPGGFGTLDETLEIIASKQMHMHRKPIVFVNAKGFWEPLVSLFEHLFRERFASAQHHRHLYHLAQEPAGVFEYLDAYVPPPFPAKWF
ncbi:TIGR00730 family Rossman fold protein [Archangium lansingense]|uniref:AMP nucleosidase n=1 Tax=Archangium lansingense TaxID=2995310 RepID=A0ABT4A0Y7_9BACT|nr:TIGR00730 family Rossman fold protein [Archangium lansinium]MCY1075021.1 TIGR00730 family Rossman fold protein [Archangium lansinium]